MLMAKRPLFQMDEHRYMCPFCWQIAGLLKLDKKNRPTFYCGYCGTRTFISSGSAMKWFRLVAGGLVAQLQQQGYVGQISATQEELVGQIKSVRGADDGG